MKKHLLLVSGLLLACCSPKPDPYWEKMKPLTNEQITSQKQLCDANGMREWYHQNFHGQTVQVECY